MLNQSPEQSLKRDSSGNSKGSSPKFPMLLKKKEDPYIKDLKQANDDCPNQIYQQSDDDVLESQGPFIDIDMPDIWDPLIHIHITFYSAFIFSI